jgi:NAD(P)-dependent dehydrogenase (short-subunit alcohol dehydrogenase family)
MFRGKVALVTGGGSGMGQLAARRLAATGAQVYAIDVNEAGLADTARGATSVVPVVCDVTDAEAVAAVVARAVAEAGPIDRVVTAAAIAPSGRVLDMPIADFERVMAINYGGTINTLKAVVPAMVERGSGDVVVFASLAGWLPSPHLGAYSASKFAVVAFTETMSEEYRHAGLRYCCVCPPIVETPLLTQQTSKPKTFDPGVVKPLTADVVIDAIEVGLERGHLYVFPGRQAPWVQRLRRLRPQLLWKQMHRIEGD